MNTSFTLKLSELDAIFLAIVKTAFKNEIEVRIDTSSTEYFGLNQPETKKEYIARILKAKANFVAGKGVEITEAELNELYINTLM